MRAAAAIVQTIQADGLRMTALKLREDEDHDAQIGMWQTVAAREQREREEWARTQSTVGGVTMTGSGWSKLAERLRNDEDLRSYAGRWVTVED